MKKRGVLALFLVLLSFLALLSLPLAAAETPDNSLYRYDQLDLRLTLNGGFELIPQAANSRMKDATAQLLLVPKEDFRQQLTKLETEGERQDGSIRFYWNDKKIEEKSFSYKADIHNTNERLRVQRKIPYPLSSEGIKGQEQYLLPTLTIDSNHPSIAAKAAELAEGEDDLFHVVFNLASWVEGNVKYDLNTLTETASQKASWVLENKQGVCDEMTSLFVAMARSLGIPARFASGISYTTLDLFDENWQPHGWAEAYFPGLGWVPFDITFGEYGYVDVTHIKLRDGFDPSEPATRYQWIAENVDLRSQDLRFGVQIMNRGKLFPEEIQLEQEILAPQTGFGSFNLVKGILRNTADYYAATSLQLAAPDEITIIGRNKRTLLLKPKEVKETYWLIEVPRDLKEGFSYTFPLLIYSEKNVSVQDEFSVQDGKNTFTRQEIEKVVVSDEDKSYNRKVTGSCDNPAEIAQNQPTTITCTLKNGGDVPLQKVNFCINDICEMVDIPVAKEVTQQVTVKADTIGWNKLFVTAENALIEKKLSFGYLVVDLPKIAVKAEYPSQVSYPDAFRMTLHLSKASLTLPQQVTVLLQGPLFENKWEISELQQDEILAINLNDIKMSGSNTFTVTTTWKDKSGRAYSEKQEIVIAAKGKTFTDTIKMLFNKLAVWLMSE